MQCDFRETETFILATLFRSAEARRVVAMNVADEQFHGYLDVVLDCVEANCRVLLSRLTQTGALPS